MHCKSIFLSALPPSLQANILRVYLCVFNTCNIWIWPKYTVLSTVISEDCYQLTKEEDGVAASPLNDPTNIMHVPLILLTHSNCVKKLREQGRARGPLHPRWDLIEETSVRCKAMPFSSLGPSYMTSVKKNKSVIRSMKIWRTLNVGLQRKTEKKQQLSSHLTSGL